MDASLTHDGPRYTIRFERRLAHPPEKVWRSLTERKYLRRWFPSDVFGEWKKGAKLDFTFKDGEADPMEGEVLSVEYPRLLEYRWGESILRFELTAEGDGCRLHFSEAFEDSSIAARNAAGWETCLRNLEEILRGYEPAAFDLGAWRILFERYVSRFEPLAGSQQGPPETHPAVVAEKAERKSS